MPQSHEASVGTVLKSLARNAGLTVLGAGALGSAALTWGWWERQFPVVRELNVALPLSRGISDLSILHISDLHLYPGQEFLVDFLRSVRQSYDIDFVVSTGDNLGDAAGLDLATEAYSYFSDVPGAFVFGSNDYFSPLKKNWTRYLRKDARREKDQVREPDLPWVGLAHQLLNMGWSDLSNRADVIDVPLRGSGEGSSGRAVQRIALLGVDDPHINRDRLSAPAPQWHEDNVLRLGLTHAPYVRTVDGLTDAGADLILAGHTHAGQFGLPGCAPLVTNCDLPRYWAQGLHEWHTPTASSQLHVSAGLGTSPFVPFRIASRPEATILRVISSEV